jgi:nucleoside-diphosphate-sugar epimerase
VKALITGAAGGIGAALVGGFRDAGYEVLAVDRGKIAMCRAHYAAVGLGADYVDQFVR